MSQSSSDQSKPGSNNSKRLKVLVFLWTFPPYRYVGGELVTIDMLKYLRDQGHEVTIYCKQIPKAYEYEGFSLERSVYLRPDIAAQYDVFVTHPEIRTSIMSNVRALPYVAIVHNVAGSTLRSLERQPPVLTIANSAFTQSHIPIVAREHELGVHVIHPPTLMEGMDGPRDKIGIVNFSIEKGGDILKYVAEKNPDIPFIAVMGGHGVQIDVASLPNVELIQQTSDMRPVYARMRGLMFPTRSETYGKVAAEATQFGIPLLMADVPSLHEVCGDSALYLDTDDYGAWDKAVRTIATQDSQYERWAALSRERGKVLREQSLSDLARWEDLLIQASERKPYR